MPQRSPFTQVNAAVPLKFRFISGAVAGNLTVTGIKPGDQLQFVGGTKLTEGTPNTFNPVADLTSEFSITAANTINNTGGTSTAATLLMVVWFSADPKLG